jgi:inorganic pyrophosphatase
MPSRSRRSTSRRPSNDASAAVHRFRPHPWHGLEIGPDPPEVLNAYIEITPFDLMKYEVDKVSGYLRVDRPQRSSAQPPTLYGFIPRTYCDERVRRLAPTARRGDGDPLDVCVLSERAIARNEIIVGCRVIGGLQMIDGGEADDKIISVLDNDHVWGGARDISDVPSVLVERLQHYFLTYKLVPGQRATARIRTVYGRVQAFKVVRAAMADYDEAFARSRDAEVRESTEKGRGR